LSAIERQAWKKMVMVHLEITSRHSFAVSKGKKKKEKRKKKHTHTVREPGSPVKI